MSPIHSDKRGALAAVLAVGVVAFLFRRKLFRTKADPPLAPSWQVIIGHVATLLKGSHVIGPLLFDGMPGNVVELDVMGSTAYMVRGPENVKRALSMSDRVGDADAKGLVELNLYKKGILLNVDHASWKRNRKLFVEGIGKPKFLKSLAPSVDEYMRILCESMDTVAGSSLPILSDVFFGCVALDLMMAVTFTERHESAVRYLKHIRQDRPADVSQHKKDHLLSLVHDTSKAIQFFIQTPPLLWKFVPSFRREATTHRKSSNQYEDFLFQKLLTTKQNLDVSDKSTIDFATSLLLASESDQSNQFPVEQALSCIKEAVFGATDTSSNTLSFIILEICRNPSIGDKICKEVVSVVGLDGNLTQQSLEHLPYVDAVIAEVGRCYTQAQVVWRQLNQDLEMDGYHLKKDSAVFVAIQQNHLDPELWADPKAFNPDRFYMQEKKELGGPMGLGFSYVPFGYGVRKCPGESLALLQMKIVVAHLCRRYTFKMAEPVVQPDIFCNLLLECHNLRVVVEKRLH
ncbi:hypothetical protein HDU77_000015 [Chytriomyces hyalinus]|nr:hypothetical protein HDU77_000015 [Chytriomyces hyalinus]